MRGNWDNNMRGNWDNNMRGNWDNMWGNFEIIIWEVTLR